MDYTYKKDIDALIDNELSTEKRQRVIETIKAFPTLQNYYNSVLVQKRLLNKWWASEKKKYH